MGSFPSISGTTQGTSHRKIYKESNLGSPFSIISVPISTNHRETCTHQARRLKKICETHPRYSSSLPATHAMEQEPWGKVKINLNQKLKLDFKVITSESEKHSEISPITKELQIMTRLKYLEKRHYVAVLICIVVSAIV